MQSNNMLHTFVKILSTCVCTTIRSLTQHPCALLVWKHKSPFLLVKMCTWIKGKTPAGGHCLQELAEGSLGGFAICCPSCPFEHIHLLLLPLVLQLASLTASRGYTLPPSSFPSPVVSLLVVWHSCVFSSIPL